MGDKNLLKALALATQLGFTIACPLVVFIAGGVWADSKFGTGHWLFFIGLFLGIAAAGYALYQIAASPTGKRTDPDAKKAQDKIETEAHMSDMGNNSEINSLDNK